jgi:hypothetical protein
VTLAQVLPLSFWIDQPSVFWPVPGGLYQRLQQKSEFAACCLADGGPFDSLLACMDTVVLPFLSSTD